MYSPASQKLREGAASEGEEVGLHLSLAALSLSSSEKGGHINRLIPGFQGLFCTSVCGRNAKGP